MRGDGTTDTGYSARTTQPQQGVTYDELGPRTVGGLFASRSTHSTGPVNGEQLTRGGTTATVAGPSVLTVFDASAEHGSGNVATLLTYLDYHLPDRVAGPIPVVTIPTVPRVGCGRHDAKPTG